MSQQIVDEASLLPQCNSPQQQYPPPEQQQYPQQQQQYPPEQSYPGQQPPPMMQAASKHPKFMDDPKQLWSTGLCECFSDCSSCLDNYFCSCCNISRQCNATEGQLNVFTCGYCVVSCCYYSVSMCVVRSRIVTKYNIVEDGCHTVLTICLCQVCALCQQYRELSARGSWPGGMCCATEPPMIEAKAFVNPNTMQ